MSFTCIIMSPENKETFISSFIILMSFTDLFLLLIHIECVCVHTYMLVHSLAVRGLCVAVREQLRELAFSFSMWVGDLTQFVRLGGQHVCTLNHLTSPLFLSNCSSLLLGVLENLDFYILVRTELSECA